MWTRITAFFGLMLAAFGQAPEAAKFDLASITPNADRVSRYRGIFLRSGRLEFRGATLVQLAAFAYKVDAEKVAGGPSWADWDRFDVTAKVDGRPGADALRPRLQALLAERFGLAVKQDVKPMPAYVISQGKKVNLKKSNAPGDAGCQVSFRVAPQQGPDGARPTPMFSLNCKGVSMATFAEQLHGIPGTQANLPVIDKTGIEGNYDIELTFAANGPPGLGAVAEAVEKQLGLKMEQGSVPQDVVSLGTGSHRPTADKPEAIAWAKSSAPPLEFEVADIKPTPPDFRGMRMNYPPGGRVDLQGVPMDFLLSQAFDLLPGEAIVGQQSWFSEDRFNIIAKAPASANGINLTRNERAGNSSAPTVDNDTTQAMMRALLKDRFKLELHWEDRPGVAYSLVPAKPKMKKADGESRTGAIRSQGERRADGPPVVQFAIQNMTMPQFAEWLGQMGRPFLPVSGPVKDATGLDGSYDFTLAFSPIVRMGGRGGMTTFAFGAGPRAEARPAGGDSTLNASDPIGGLTLIDALEKLGLKLEKQTRPVPTLVIDHIERKPTDN